MQCKVAALNISPLDTYKYPKEVGWEIDQNSKVAYLNLAQIINTDSNISGTIIQHEYGIFGGVEGENVLTFMENCKKPMLVTLHTALPLPNPIMEKITSKIVKLASTIVVLTKSSKEIIEKIYPESTNKIFVIPHGIHPVEFVATKGFKGKIELKDHIILSTFGLLSRGKGIEYVINALPEVVKKYPSVLYLILGETHPVIRRNEGETYRKELAKLITKLGLEKHVKFYDQYLTLPDLFDFLRATDLYIATSTDPNQAVSGTLSYALGSGRAVISTEFAQAKEIVTEDVGRLVPIKDSPAVTKAMLELLKDKKRLQQMNRNAYDKTRYMLWSNVAERYINLFVYTVTPPIKISHLQNMTDDFGLFQFAVHATPNKDFGYTLDDNARALIVCSWLLQKKYSQKLEELITIYLMFIKKCQRKNGSFINYISYEEKLPTDQNNHEDLEESQTRALWALSEVIRNKSLSEDLRYQAKKIFLLSFKQKISLTHLRSRAFIIKTFATVIDDLPEHREVLKTQIKEQADALIMALQTNSVKSWQWFEKELNYNNALLAESLLIAGKTTGNKEYIEKGMISLRFLISKTFSANRYMPIGHTFWYKNKQKRSEYDQQPEDPTSMILALVRAYKNTQNEEYKNLAKQCFSWFLGNNSLHLPLYNEITGGCYDGLHRDRVNANQGAESLVSYLMANISIARLQ